MLLFSLDTRELLKVVTWPFLILITLNVSAQSVGINDDGIAPPSTINVEIDFNKAGDATTKTWLLIDGDVITASQTANLTGIDINLGDGAFSSTATNIGLNVDVSGLSGGTNYAGIFMGGSVGIGTNPTANVDLELGGDGKFRILSTTDLNTPATGKGLELYYLNITDRAYINSVDQSASLYKGLSLNASAVTAPQGKVGIGFDGVVTNSLEIGTSGTTGDQIIDVMSRGDAAIWLLADPDNNSVGNAYLRLSQDNTAVQALLGTVQTAGQDPQGNAYTSTVANATLLGTLDANALQLGTNDNVRMTILSTGEVGINTTPATSRMLQVFKDNNANKYVIHGDAHQTSTTVSYQNVGIFGFAQGTNASFGYAAGIMGIGGQANSLRAIGVYAGLGGAPATIPSTDAALYSDAASLGYSGIFMNGDVGIGTASPIFKTHILGDDGVAEHGLLIDGDGESSDIPFRVRSNVVVSSITDADTKFIIKGNGNVGIGTSSPGTKLEVAGQVKITGGTPGVDQVLTSDASGLATWETPGANNDNWSLSAKLAYSEDDISGWTTLSGDDSYVNITLPFSITIGGTSYSIVHLSTNGWLEFFTSGGGTVTDASNDCLPSTSHSNPMLCWFWDDLVPNGTNIRYTTLGTSPNRVFFIDFDVNIWSTTDDIEGMIQIHEGSALMNVSYKETLDAGARGQTATIGFQLAGGASAKVYPIGCNVAVIDDNQAFESGWSVCPAR